MSGRRRRAKVLALYRSLGPRKLLARLLRRAAATVYARRVELVFVKRLDQGKPLHLPHNELRIRAVTPADASALQRFNERYRTKTKVRACGCYLQNDYGGFLAFLDNELVGYWWWVGSATDPALIHPYVDRFELSLKDDEVFAFDYFIASEHRGRGTGVKFLASIYRELETLGYRRVWGSVDADNIAARWLYKVHGNEVVRRMTGHELCSSVLVQDRRIFVRNTRWNPRRPFDWRPLPVTLRHGV
jgi:GNAT superfamily N-acetyltransferase